MKKKANTKKVAIFHFLPLEGYPPIQNLINFLALKNNIKLYCFSTIGKYQFKYKNNNTTIYRFGLLNKYGFLSKILLWLSYINYSIFSIIYTFIIRPDILIYYETISAIPSIFFKLFGSRKPLFIHYHEYTSKNEYLNGPAIYKFIHSLEKHLYKNASWISHTNYDRLWMFADDNQLLLEKNLYVMPNYPPKSWMRTSLNRENKELIKLVYVGYSLADETMYANEIINFAAKHPNSISLTFYLFNTPKEYIRKVEELNIDNIHFLPSLNYQQIPDKIYMYDIGLIIYKGTSLNYEFNAPNKLFEYLAVNLNVIFPKEMKGCYDYIRNDSFPFVKKLDFEKLNIKEIKKLLSENKNYEPSNYWCDDVYEDIYNKIITQ